MSESDAGPITLFLCGDVMTGRGVDQVLPHPVDPRLCEGYVRSALGYVEIAERANGPIPKPVDFAYIWGAALDELARVRPDARIINLETSITRSETCLPKGINYRMSPENAPVLTAAGVDCCALANNHVLDWGTAGLIETLTTLDAAGIARAGAGRTLAEAEAPAVIETEGKGRVIVVSYGEGSSGIPRDWRATGRTPGVARLDDLSAREMARIAETVQRIKRPSDVVVASIHWGGNWGYEIPATQIDFAHGLIDTAGVNVVHGHSAHHVKGIEVYKGKPILYGCGDFINDYEGISGYESFRDDLALMYFARMDPRTGTLAALRMTPLQVRNFRLNRAARADAAWLAEVLSREGARFGTGATLGDDDRLTLTWT